tara:strand:- start:312 stop:656 length:345 start_codon:yes stop_codon:yes gene_type:complete
MKEVIPMHAAFMLTLKPGGIDEYTRRHDEIWPELVTELAVNGVTQVTIFHVDSTLFVFSAIDHSKAWEQVWNTEIHLRWAAELEPYLELADDGTPASRDLSQIFHLRPGAVTQE